MLSAKVYKRFFCNFVRNFSSAAVGKFKVSITWCCLRKWKLHHLCGYGNNGE